MSAPTLELLGVLVPDVGRLTNRMWCYFAPGVVQVAAPIESGEGISVIKVPEHEAMLMAADGRMDHALNLAVLMLAVGRHKVSVE
jgi:hypothetical protein